jgi:aminopeptidase N
MRKRFALLVLLLCFLPALPAHAQEPPNPAALEGLRPPFNDPRATRHGTRSRTYDLQHVKLELGLDWKTREVSGLATLRLAPLNDGLARVELDAADLTMEAVLLRDHPLEFATSGEQLHVTLDRPYAAGETFELALRYRTHPRKGLYFSGPDDGYPRRTLQVWTQGESQYNHWWFPVYDFPNDKATSEVVVTVPADLLAISNGALVETRDNRDGTKTFHWRESFPHSTYLISLIVGRFDRFADKLGDLTVEYYVPPGTDAASVERSFAETPAMIQFFADWTGVPFPWEKYAQTTVDDFLWGGMENTSATTLFTDTLHDEAARPNFTSESLVAHELAHQWWGDYLTCRDWSHIWLNEAFATFFENLWQEHRHGRDEYDYQRWRDAQDYFCEDNQNYRPSCGDGDSYRRPIVMPVYVNEMDLFDSHTYPKGGLVLDMLRYTLGDALFQKALRHYAARFAHQPVDTDDLRKAISEATGQELGWFFEQWVESGGHPEFHVEAEWNAEAKQLHLVVEQRQPRRELTPIFRVPVEVEVTTAQGTQVFRLEVSRARGDFELPLAAPPTRIRFDPGQRLLKTLDFPKSRDELLDLLKNDPNVIGRIWAAEQLGRRTNDLVAAGALRQALAQEPFYGVRREVARILGEMRTAAARDALRDALRDPDARVRERAAEALGEFQRDAAAAAALESVVAAEPKTYVVAAALKSLGRMHAESAFERLKAALGRESHAETLRRAALKGLADLGPEASGRGYALAKEWSRYGRPPRAREAAIEALGKLGRGRDDALPYLVSLLNDPYIWARRSALSALGELGDSRVLPKLEAFAATEIERRLQREAERTAEKLRRAAQPRQE